MQSVLFGGAEGEFLGAAVDDEDNAYFVGYAAYDENGFYRELFYHFTVCFVTLGCRICFCAFRGVIKL